MLKKVFVLLWFLGNKDKVNELYMLNRDYFLN